jgi:hypothetical protein
MRHRGSLNFPTSAQAEPVEALPFFEASQRAGRPFDKLRAGGDVMPLL